MGKAKPGLTLKEHKELGIDLYEIRDRLMKLVVLLSKSYPHKEFKGYPQKATELLDKIRCHLDDLVHKENHTLTDEELSNVYYCAEEWKRRREQRFNLIEGGKK